MNKNSVTEKDLIAKLRQLSQIKPSKDWAFSVKSQILGQDYTKRRFNPFLWNPWQVFQFKPILIGAMSGFVLLAMFGYSFVKNSLPGDFLYTIRKVSHQGQAIFVSEEDKPAFQLKLANKSLEDLAKAPAKNLSPTINEFQASLSAAAKNLARIAATTSDAVVIKKIVEETKKLEENKKKVAALGVVIGEEEATELESALGKLVENLIKDLEQGTLSQEKEEILNAMKELFEKGEYSSALELYLLSQ